MATDGEFVLSILEQVGTKVRARNRKVGRVLNRHPPVVADQHLRLDPVGDGLLTGLGFPELTELGRKPCLPTADFDGPLERNKVRFIHEARDYTNSFVHVNNSICVTDNKADCMVLAMPTKKTNVARLRTPVVRARKTPPNPVGADGKTLAQRLEIAMAYKHGQTGAPYSEKDLIIDSNRAAGHSMDNPLISQQIIHAILKGRVARSNFTPFMADALGVRPVWLSGGLGEMTDK